ncbi:MAG TPA: acetyl-CoA carboxylase biotin carboxyl carrier protein [Ginsengibacter sp.]|nr:acetyl-CoA carboxylase biotin carboxyl carrier protein [Chitinophagaceae bacterium]HRN71693.1 acetyl-CoA carboxylase biotin carboxyl carrier protein [Ginsengibacter sp.]HRP18465.1 acetyl-CoA carboxylase biotin carboxyl carrier protein [Ginsengibacter sp.]HRP44851.1 acetyl-CoA carboxylase biotin carboxyl carrier protein [Ginsengibacter sp.]
MDIKQIQELIRLVNKSNIGEVSIEQKDFKITIKQKKDPAPIYAAPMAVQAAPAAVAQAPAPAAPPAPSAPKAETAPKAENTVTIKSPMIGTFYRQPGPDKPVFVNVGDTIEKGQIVCIIEAMKLFNEIESEVSGKIVKVLVEDSQPVEFDQPLFLVEV